ncbi:MAG TPA: hypothetical protein VHX42_05285, partial [Candidatus Babeliales bacterium]|nr:hypothetical protein [Candidatus Babeliales bacterium]
MNRAYQKASSLLLSAMIMSSVHGMESNNIAEGTTEQVASVVWYKKGSVQIAAIATTVLALCAVAVYKGKVAVPA